MKAFEVANAGQADNTLDRFLRRVNFSFSLSRQLRAICRKQATCTMIRVAHTFRTLAHSVGRLSSTRCDLFFAGKASMKQICITTCVAIHRLCHAMNEQRTRTCHVRVNSATRVESERTIHRTLASFVYPRSSICRRGIKKTTFPTVCLSRAYVSM